MTRNLPFGAARLKLSSIPRLPPSLMDLGSYGISVSFIIQLCLARAEGSEFSPVRFPLGREVAKNAMKLFVQFRDGIAAIFWISVELAIAPHEEFGAAKRPNFQQGVA